MNPWSPTEVRRIRGEGANGNGPFDPTGPFCLDIVDAHAYFIDSAGLVIHDLMGDTTTLIFADGFESGDTRMWTAQIP